MQPAEGTAPRGGRGRWRWAGAVVAIAGLLVAFAAWVLPQPSEAICNLSNERMPGCSDVPSGYVGRWQGTMTAIDYGLIFSPSRKQFPSTLTINRGRVDKVVAREVGDESQPATACVQEWRLTAVHEDSLSFHVASTYPLDPSKMAQDGVLRRCTPDLSVTAKLTPQDTLQIEVMAGPGTSPLLVPTGLRLFHGTLSRS